MRLYSMRSHPRSCAGRKQCEPRSSLQLSGLNPFRRSRLVLPCCLNLAMLTIGRQALRHMQVVSHKHLRQRIECWVATGGSMPADSAATLAEAPRMCASEASYQVLSQGPPRADSCTVPDSPRADSVATSAGHVSAVRRRVSPRSVTRNLPQDVPMPPWVQSCECSTCRFW